MEKRLSIRDEALQVSDLRVIHCRVVDFRDDAIPQGEPNSARSCIRCPHAVFVAVSPSWLYARSSESDVFLRRSPLKLTRPSSAPGMATSNDSSTFKSGPFSQYTCSLFTAASTDDDDTIASTTTLMLEPSCLPNNGLFIPSAETSVTSTQSSFT